MRISYWSSDVCSSDLFDVEILIREVDAEYIAEHEEEKNLIAISAFSTRHTKTPPLIPFDLVTREIMAAESGGAPQFEATLASKARSEERRVGKASVSTWNSRWSPSN